LFSLFCVCSLQSTRMCRAGADGASVQLQPILL
jgi:hypothetical protein